MEDTRNVLFDSDIIPAHIEDVILNTFELIGFAEEEIDAAKVAHPEHADEINAIFSHTRPVGALQSNVTEHVYRAHVRELIARVVDGEDLTPGTDAEVCAALSEVSLAAPLDSDYAAAYGQAFGRIFPEKQQFVDGYLTGTYPGAVEEALNETRRKCGKLAARPKKVTA